MHNDTPPVTDVGGGARVRAPQEGIPATKAHRDALLQAAREYVRRERPVPPLSLEELAAHTARLIASAGENGDYHDFITVLLNNELWRDTLAAIPFERRLLLLPQCLRTREVCPATIDEYGLLCRRCGKCPTRDLQTEAEALGYVVLVAEGSAVVTGLIATGKIEAVVGVSCMPMLERVFPQMHAAGVPGFAVPLLYDGCDATAADLDWVRDAICLTSGSVRQRLDLDAVGETVRSWCRPEALRAALGAPASPAEQLAHDWVARSGKRWRPILTVCAYQALQDDPGGHVPEELRKVAVAIECFHKASLVHDDIEDGDALRYGQQTLHEQHGLPVALNVGDLLVGEGYRLLAESSFPPALRSRMVRVAADGHRALCIGQGEELQWARRPRTLSVREVVDIFRRKTAPAFEVALQLGAICAEADDGVEDVLAAYSEQLGIAYQIRDDLKDLNSSDEPDDVLAGRPSVLLAIACSRASAAALKVLERAWESPEISTADAQRVHCILSELRVEQAAMELLGRRKDAAIRALRPLRVAPLKSLLQRLVAKIFNDVCGTDAQP